MPLARLSIRPAGAAICAECACPMCCGPTLFSPLVCGRFSWIGELSCTVSVQCGRQSVDPSGEFDGDHQIREREERNPGARRVEPSQEALRAGVGLYPGINKVLNCHGFGHCGTCRVLITKGMENASPMGFMERMRLKLSMAYIGNEDTMRLACQTERQRRHGSADPAAVEPVRRELSSARSRGDCARDQSVADRPSRSAAVGRVA